VPAINQRNSARVANRRSGPSSSGLGFLGATGSWVLVIAGAAMILSGLVMFAAPI
jgi:hypothetical protein